MPLIIASLHEAVSNYLLAAVGEDENDPAGDERRQHQGITDFLLDVF